MKWSSFFQYVGVALVVFGVIITLFSSRLPDDSYLVKLSKDNFFFFIGLGIWAIGEVKDKQQIKKASKETQPEE